MSKFRVMVAIELKADNEAEATEEVTHYLWDAAEVGWNAQVLTTEEIEESE